MLSSKSLIDEDHYNIIDNDIGNYGNSFQLGFFWMIVTGGCKSFPEKD